LQVIFAQVQKKLDFWKEDGPHLKNFSIALLSTAKSFIVHNLALKLSQCPRSYRQNKEESGLVTAPQLRLTHLIQLQHKPHVTVAAEETFIPAIHISESKQNERQREHLQNHPVQFERVHLLKPLVF